MTYYEGLNIGLNYDASTGTWGFTNQPQNFIDPNAFSTTDQEFVYAPPETIDPDTPEQDPCPPGYVYDTELKQCVPDPNFQAPDFLGQPKQEGGDPNKDNPQAEFIDFDASTPEGRQFMYNHAVKSGYINDKGQLLGPPKAPTVGFLTPVMQFGITRQYNRWLKELGAYDSDMKSKGLATGFVQAIGMAPTLLPSFYDPEGETKLRTTSGVSTPITDDQITETKADPLMAVKNQPAGNSYTSPEGDTYTSTGDGGITFTPAENNPAVEQATQSDVKYGAGRGRSVDAGTGGTSVNYGGNVGFASPQGTQQSYSSMFKDTDKPEGDAGI